MCLITMYYYPLLCDNIYVAISIMFKIKWFILISNFKVTHIYVQFIKNIFNYLTKIVWFPIGHKCNSIYFMYTRYTKIVTFLLKQWINWIFFYCSTQYWIRSSKIHFQLTSVWLLVPACKNQLCDSTLIITGKNIYSIIGA
jgi:hypothetical protein